ncbi:uncharacterized protein LOC144925316 [Branchiostoma floridae x Branchiostoma belcheri]
MASQLRFVHHISHLRLPYIWANRRKPTAQPPKTILSYPSVTDHIFVCSHADGVIVDGNIHDDFHGYYSLTTPFTTWVIDVSTDLNSGLDLSGLSRVEMHLWGSLVSGSRDRQPLDNLVIDL